jgi:hypothetical protein
MSNTSQIIDLNANNGNEFTPAYAVYDGGVPTKVILFNYITDPSGTSDYNVIISIGGQNGTPNAIPASVQVKSVTTTPFLFVSKCADGKNFQVLASTFCFGKGEHDMGRASE